MNYRLLIKLLNPFSAPVMPVQNVKHDKRRIQLNIIIINIHHVSWCHVVHFINFDHFFTGKSALKLNFKIYTFNLTYQNHKTEFIISTVCNALWILKVLHEIALRKWNCCTFLFLYLFLNWICHFGRPYIMNEKKKKWTEKRTNRIKKIVNERKEQKEHKRNSSIIITCWWPILWIIIEFFSLSSTCHHGSRSHNSLKVCNGGGTFNKHNIDITYRTQTQTQMHRQTQTMTNRWMVYLLYV